MIPCLLSPPAVEPLSLAEAKAWLRLDGADEDDLVASLLVSARMLVERLARRCLIEQTWRLVAGGWPVNGRIALPLAPVSAVAAIRVYDAAGVAQSVPTAALRLLACRSGAELVATAPLPQPGRTGDGIEIDIICGFGPAATDVPEPLRHAVRLLLARWFENRGDAAADERNLPGDIAALLGPYRHPRLA